MSVRVPLHLVIALLVAGVTLSACGATTLRELAGLPKVDDPSVEIKAAEPKWLLIKNPRFPDIASEPEYIWVEEDKIPTTIGTLVFGKSSLIASPEIVAKYGAPPGGGRISPRQKVAVATAPPAPPAKGAANTTGKGGTQPAAGPLPTNRGFVVFVDTSRVVIDLNGKDGVKPGAQVSVRRDKIAIVHPITGELLGELDEEVATGRVTEVKEKFSVVELQSVASGNQVKIKDRVVVR
jgi:Flagellar assembly protein T, C-terminal domain